MKITQVKKWISSYTPECVLFVYHYAYALWGVVRYGNPSRKCVIIGVTGTKGKTTTATFLHALFTAAGKKTGLLTTVETRIGTTIIPNTTHLTMAGRGKIQKQIKKMVDAGCIYVIVETSSDGIRQFRHTGIQYDSLIYTNLSKEHLITHSTMENYRNTKGRLFSQHARKKEKIIQGKKIKRYVLLNADDTYTPYFEKISRSPHSKLILYGLHSNATAQATIKQSDKTATFTFEGTDYAISMAGIFQVYNVLPAIILVTQYCDVDSKKLQHAVSQVQVAGRLEIIHHHKSFTVFCDYAHEPLSITSAAKAARMFVEPNGKLIIIIGSVGGGRWKYNAYDIGKSAAQHADHIVITDVDPFYDDPQEIINETLKGVIATGAKSYVTQIDRKKAITSALQLANAGDVVLITGKGAECTMEVKGSAKKWDERAIIKQIIQR